MAASALDSRARRKTKVLRSKSCFTWLPLFVSLPYSLNIYVFKDKWISVHEMFYLLAFTCSVSLI